MPDEMAQTMAVLQMAASGQNIASFLPGDELAKIGNEAVRLYKLDKASMKDWLAQMEKGIELAKLVATDKAYPWPKASNVKYPLLTTAALQFNARSLPAIIPPEGNIVKPKTYGSDPQGRKAARAERVAGHMSYQLMVQMPEWKEETDRLLTQLPIVGTMVRKVWRDDIEGRNRCRLVEPGAFIVNDKVKTLSDAPRKTEEFALYPHEINSKRRAGIYRDVDLVEPDAEDDQSPQDFIEQHCRLDLDGDGYEEPYIVTVHVETERVARIVGDFTEEDIATGPRGITRIRANTYFVAYHFMPSLDGGFWGTGFGLLLGSTSEAINSIINLMLDAGHMASLGGGFIGSDFRIKGGHQRMRPGEWKKAQAKGAEIRNSIVPLTLPGPDATLFKLLGLMIESAQDVAGIKDILLGESGDKVQTATTTMALIEQGMQQYTAVYTRIYWAMGDEFKLLAKLNTSVDPAEYNAFHDDVMPAMMMGPNGQPMPVPGPDGQPQMVPAQFNPREEYALADMDICPVADPRSVTKMQEMAKAQLVMDLAINGQLDRMEAARRILEAGAVTDVDDLLPKPDPIAEQMGQLQFAAAQADVQLKQVELMKAEAEIGKLRADAAATLSGIELEQAETNLKAMEIRLKDDRERLATLVKSGDARMATVLGEGTRRMAALQGGQGRQGSLAE